MFRFSSYGREEKDRFSQNSIISCLSVSGRYLGSVKILCCQSYNLCITFGRLNEKHCSSLTDKCLTRLCVEITVMTFNIMSLRNFILNQKSCVFFNEVLYTTPPVFRQSASCYWIWMVRAGFSTLLTRAPLNKFCSDVTPPTVYNEGRTFKSLERNLSFLICKKLIAYWQERMTQINLWI